MKRCLIEKFVWSTRDQGVGVFIYLLDANLFDKSVEIKREHQSLAFSF